MAFQKKTWTDRLAEFPGRRLLKIISQSAAEIVVDVFRNEGKISKEGDPYNAANMNDLEQRIADGFTQLYSDIVKISDYTFELKGMLIHASGNYYYLDIPYASFGISDDATILSCFPVSYTQTTGVPYCMLKGSGNNFRSIRLICNVQAVAQSITYRIVYKDPSGKIGIDSISTFEAV